MLILRHYTKHFIMHFDNGLVSEINIKTYTQINNE